MYNRSNKEQCSPDEHDDGNGPPSWFFPVMVFWSYGQAAGEGYLSKSQWRKRHRQPLPDAPTAIVVRKTGIADGWGDYPIIEDRGNDIYLVAAKYYWVIHKDHTEPLQSIAKGHATASGQESVVNSPGNENVIQSQIAVPISCIPSSNQSPSHVHPSPLITTIDRKEADENSIPVEETRGFTIINRHEKSVNKGGTFVPENFSTQDGLRLGDLLEEAYCVFHNMHLFRVIRRLPKDAWIDLHYDYFDRRLPNWRKLRPMLLDGILERTEEEEFPLLDIVVPRGVKGGKCYGYRFKNEEYRNARVRKRSIINPKLIEMIEAHRNVKYPVQRWLQKNLQQAEMADVPEETLLELAAGEDDPQVRYYTYKEQIDLIREKAWIFVADKFSRRIHTNLTQLKRELRAGLRVAGEPLVQIDIKNSQPLFIGLAARRMGVDDRRYLELCQVDLYQHLADQGGWTRSQVKEQLTQAALFASNGSPHQRLPVKQLFDAQFPKMATFIHYMKDGKKTEANPKPHNKLAKLAQKTEANFVIYDGVCERIRRERPDCWLGTIHDSLLMLPGDVDYGLAVMRAEFAKLGVEPRLVPEPCDK
jgi:hypothetical protein